MLEIFFFLTSRGRIKNMRQRFWLGIKQSYEYCMLVCVHVWGQEAQLTCSCDQYHVNIMFGVRNAQSHAESTVNMCIVACINGTILSIEQYCLEQWQRQENLSLPKSLNTKMCACRVSGSPTVEAKDHLEFGYKAAELLVPVVEC